MSLEERQERIAKMVDTRKSRGTLGNNNKKCTGTYEGVTFHSRCEERFLKKHLKSYEIRNCEPLVGENFYYQPDFWSDRLTSYIEVKSPWTFEVMTGRKKYNSKDDRQQCSQLGRIKSLRKTHRILFCVEINGNFYFVDPADVYDDVSVCALTEECKSLSQA